MEEKTKVYVYEVNVVNEKGSILHTYYEQTQKDIECIKKKLKKNERVKYMPTGIKIIN